MRIKSYPSQEIIRNALDYNPETGVFVWKFRPELKSQDNSRICGKIAEYKNAGYWKIIINNVAYLAHRLAWIYMKGDIPEGVLIDHIFDNFRLCVHKTNSANAKRHKNKILPKGIQQLKGSGRFMARIMNKGKAICLGTFDTINEAVYFRNYAAEYYHGEFARNE